jgi:hypothetical protein
MTRGITTVALRQLGMHPGHLSKSCEIMKDERTPMPKKPTIFALQPNNWANTGIGMRIYLNKFEIKTLIKGLDWLQNESVEPFGAEFRTATAVRTKLRNLLRASTNAQ